MRFQSVLDRLFAFFTFFMVCLSERNDADGVIRMLREYHKGRTPSNHPNAYPPLLAIVLTGVRTNEENATEHLLRFGEVKPVLPDISPILGLDPLKKSS